MFLFAAPGTMESDTRFAHLLQPIRDLAKNWEVDIASHLEDYVTEVWLGPFLLCVWGGGFNKLAPLNAR